MSSFERSSAESERGRDVPSFIEARPPLVTDRWLRPKPALGTNLMDLYEDESMEQEAESDLVQVYLRVKPCAEPSALYDIRSDTLLATTLESAPSDYSRRTQCQMSKLHTFSHIFRADATQAQIFEHVVKGNLRKLPDGHSYTLLTYGASGSGKTYTLMGTEVQPGLVPRSLEYLFRLLSPAQHPLYRPRDGAHEMLSSAQQAHELELVSRLRRPAAPVRGARRVYRRMSQRLSGDFHSTSGLASRHTHYVWVSFVEIYNEAVYDLLQRADRSKVASKLRIYEDPNGTVYVKGATQAFVRTGIEAYDVMSAGRLNLRVAATGVHAHSSRSHCIFTITLLTDTPDGLQSSCVRLCDLAGSERAVRTHNEGVRMAESRAINSSLHVLERCLHMLRRKQRAANATDAAASFLVPFRESKLTRLLGAPLSGASREAVSMVVTINPSQLYAQETRHVLQLAAVASTICVNSTTVEDVGLESTADSSTESSREMTLIALRADNERLRFEIERLYTRLDEANVMAASSREQSALTMRELVEEARDASRHYYTQQMSLQDERHRREKDRLQKQMNALIAENTKLKEQLGSRPLEMAVVESELEHLHACLAERDRADSGEMNKEKSPPESVVVLDSESESESDEQSDSDYDPQLDTISEGSMLSSKRTTEEWSQDFADKSITDDIINTTCKPNHEYQQTITCIKEIPENKEATEYESDDDNEIQIGNLPSINCSKNNKRTSLVDNNSLTSQNVASIPKHIIETVNQKDCKKVSFDNDISRGDAHMSNTDPAISSTDSEHTVGSEALISNLYAVNYDNISDHASICERTINEEHFSSDNTINSKVHCNDEHDNNTEFSVGSKSIIKELDPSILIPHSTETNKVEIPNWQSNDTRLIDINLAKVCSKTELSTNSEVNHEMEHSKSERIDTRCNDKSNDCEKIESSFTMLNINNKDSMNESVKENPCVYKNLANSSKMDTMLDLIVSSESIKSYEDGANKDIDENICYGSPKAKNICSLQDKFSIATFDPSKILSNTVNLKTFTVPSSSLPQMNQHVEINGSVGTQTNPFNNAVEIVLTEQNTFLKSSGYSQQNELVDTFRDLNDLIPEMSIPNKTNKSFLCSTSTMHVPEISQNLPQECASKKDIEFDGILSMCRPKSDVDFKREKELQASILENRAANECKTNLSLKKYDSISCKRSILDDSLPSLDVKGSGDLAAEVSSDTVELNKLKSQNMIMEHEIETVEKLDDHVESKADIIDEKKLLDVKLDMNIDFYLETQPVPCSLSKDIESIIGSINFNTKLEQISDTNDPSQEINPAQIDKEKDTNKRRKNLRLKKINKIEDEKVDPPVTDQQKKAKKRNTKKLKDIANLQQEFSDVTMGIPSSKEEKEVRDIPSPEEPTGEENVPPATSRSCPPKSACSRRKLYTPRAEPLEESMASDDDGNARVRIPRPSFHRTTRARRKL